MDAVLEKVTRTDMEGEETEIAHDVPCAVDTEAQQVVLTAGHDLGIQVGDELETDAFDFRRTVRGLRKERTEEGFRITLSYR